MISTEINDRQEQSKHIKNEMKDEMQNEIRGINESLENIIVYVNGNCPTGWKEYKEHEGRAALFAGDNSSLIGQEVGSDSN